MTNTDVLYIALKGVFGVYASSCTGFPVRVAEILPGAFFGEMSAVDDWSRSATVICEEDGTALLIEKDKLRTVFEKRPDIADSIVTMLKTRAEKTAAETRRQGQDIPALPGLPKGLDSTDDKMTAMAALSRQIRLMNKFLLGKAAISGGVPKKNSSVKVKLLPPGYEPINKTDTNDNEETLAEKTVFCPHCNMEQEAYIPSKSNIPQRKHSPDGRVIYKGFNILLYSNIVCYHCNYADSYQEFCRPAPEGAEVLYDRIQFQNEEGFKGFAETHKHTADEAVLCYYHQLHCLEATTRDPLRFAKAWIRLYWMYGDYKRKDLALQAAAKAEFFYSKYLQENKSRMEEYSVSAIKILLAELSKVSRNA